MNFIQKWLKLAYIAIAHKDDYQYHFDRINELKGLIEAEKDLIIALCESMKDEYEA